MYQSVAFARVMIRTYGYEAITRRRRIATTLLDMTMMPRQLVHVCRGTIVFGVLLHD